MFVFLFQSTEKVYADVAHQNPQGSALSAPRHESKPNSSYASAQRHNHTADSSQTHRYLTSTHHNITSQTNEQIKGNCCRRIETGVQLFDSPSNHLAPLRLIKTDV